jgi:hypothetical protein
MDTNEPYLFIMYPTCNTYFTHIILPYLINLITSVRRSQWPRGLRCVSAAARLLKFWVRVPPGAWMFLYCECRVLSGRGLCDEMITLPEESNRLRCVVVCDLETSWMRMPRPTGGCCAKNKQTITSVQRTQTMSHIIKPLAPSSRFPLSVRCKYSPQDRILKQLGSTISP